MADPLHAVMMAGAELKAIAPHEFEKLIAALKNYEERCRDELSAAEANVIFPAQGRAQLITVIRTKLENCSQLRANFEARKA